MTTEEKLDKLENFHLRLDDYETSLKYIPEKTKLARLLFECEIKSLRGKIAALEEELKAEGVEVPVYKSQYDEKDDTAFRAEIASKTEDK